MLITANQQNPKRTKVFLAVFAAVCLLTAGFFIWQRWGSAGEAVDLGPAAGKTGSINADFASSVLKDERILQLRQIGPARVTVSDRGKKGDPFKPF